MTVAAVAAGERLAACYREIGRLRMRGLPICNAALAVEAVGFCAWDGEAFGVLVTPWCMNLVLLDLPEAPPRAALTVGIRRDCDFPAGTITFTVAEVEAFGRVDAASLFSPMQVFGDQEGARAAAGAALKAVLAPPNVRSGRRGLLFGRGAAA
jgi:[NiFe] hydrogenase assembly HybE family chaperone